MGLFDHFPYTNFHELNLDWILQALKELEYTIEQFVAINALKYANPIQWDITSQYEKNTIVIDPQSGTAYISVKAVPAGVALTNTDYWTIVFDLERFVTKANGNFTPRVEVQTTTTATFPTSAGQWVIWGGDLYRALSNIIAGDQYVIGSNIERITVEEAKDEIITLINSIFTIIGNLPDLTTSDKTSIVNAINELVTSITAISGIIGDISNLNTTDKTSIVNAINELVARYNDADSAITDIYTNIGNLSDLTTTDKTSIVNAINEINRHLGNMPFINVKDYGVIGDGVTDDTQALQTVLDMVRNSGGGTIVFPSGDYYVTSTLNVYSNTHLIGVGTAKIICRGTEIINPLSAPQAKVGLYMSGSYSDEMNAVQGSMAGYTISVDDGTKFKKDDIIEVYSTTYRYSYEGLEDGAYTGYLAIVENVNGNILTIDHNPYSYVPDAKVRKINPVHDVLISGLIFEGFDVANTQQHGIWFKYGYNITIEHCEFIGFDWYSIGATSSINTRILNNNITGTYYDGYTGMIYFGIAALNDNYKMIVSGNTGRKIRHLFVNTSYTPITWAVGAPCKITVENNIMIGSDPQGDGASYAFQHHGFGLDILFDGNIADGCYAGFHVEGSGVTISNNIITNYLVNAISVGYGYEIQDINIIGNRIRGYIGDGRFTDQTKASILIDGTISTNIREIMISNNLIERQSADIFGIRLLGNVNDVSVIGNTINCDDLAIEAYGIHCDTVGVNTSIKANVVNNCRNGILSNGKDISNNTVEAGAATGGIGMYIRGNESAKIIGNSVAAYLPITVISNYNILVGNIFNGTEASSITGTGNTLIGNYPATLS